MITIINRSNGEVRYVVPNEYLSQEIVDLYNKQNWFPEVKYNSDEKEKQVSAGMLLTIIKWHLDKQTMNNPEVITACLKCIRTDEAADYLQDAVEIFHYKQGGPCLAVWSLFVNDSEMYQAVLVLVDFYGISIDVNTVNILSLNYRTSDAIKTIYVNQSIFFYRIHNILDDTFPANRRHPENEYFPLYEMVRIWECLKTQALQERFIYVCFKHWTIKNSLTYMVEYLYEHLDYIQAEMKNSSLSDNEVQEINELYKKEIQRIKHNDAINMLVLTDLTDKDKYPSMDKNLFRSIAGYL